MNNKILDVFNLFRIGQWYKNFLIFIPIFTAAKFFDQRLFWITVFGFFSISFISSATYIFNDIIDIKKDLLHPEKKNRPIASGKIKIRPAFIIALLLILSSFIIAISLKPLFILFPLAIFISTIIYTFYLKNIAIIDLYSIAFNHILRASAGAFLISVSLSSWFLLFIFLLSMFLATGKRKSDMSVLGNQAKNHKKVYNFYNKKFLDWLIIIFLTSMLVCYILYSFMAYDHQYFIITIPFATFLILRYLYFISISHISYICWFYASNIHIKFFIIR